MVKIEFIENNIVIDTRSINVFFNQYGKENVIRMINDKTINVPVKYDSYRLTAC